MIKKSFYVVILRCPLYFGIHQQINHIKRKRDPVQILFDKLYIEA